MSRTFRDAHLPVPGVAERLGERLEDDLEFFGGRTLIYGIDRPA